MVSDGLMVVGRLRGVMPRTTRDGEVIPGQVEAVLLMSDGSEARIRVVPRIVVGMGSVPCPAATQLAALSGGELVAVSVVTQGGALDNGSTWSRLVAAAVEVLEAVRPAVTSVPAAKGA